MNWQRCMKNKRPKSLFTKITQVTLFIFVIEVSLVLTGALVIEKAKETKAQREVLEQATSLNDQFIYEELVTQTSMNLPGAIDFIIYDIIQSKNLKMAKYLPNGDLEGYLSRRGIDVSCFDQKNYCELKSEESGLGLLEIKDKGKVNGHLLQEVSLSGGVFADELKWSQPIIVILCLLCLFNIIGLCIITKYFISNELKKLMSFISDLDHQTYFDQPITFNTKEFNKIYSKMIANLKELNRSSLEKVKLVSEAERAKLADEASHNIQSPLSALEGLYSRFQKVEGMDSGLLKEYKNISQRIKDISVDLRNKGTNTEVVDGRIDSELIQSLIEDVISEKRIIYGDNCPINFINTLREEPLFAKVNSSKFKSVISNLLENSLEALNGDEREILVLTKKIEGNISIEISDNGKGINPEVIDKVFERGFSHGKAGIKNSGSGLGLFHAKKTILSFEGQIDISSEEGVGTNVSILLPCSKRPVWLAEEIFVQEGQKVGIIDDDPSIHALWESKFDSLNANIKTYNFLNKKDFEQFISKKRVHLDIYLIDYEFNDPEYNGLDLIEGFGISEKSILVTSKFELSSIRKRCNNLSLKILPKHLLHSFKLNLHPKAQDFDLVLLDDDHLVHRTWKNQAAENDVKVLSFTAPNDFIEATKSMNKDSLIFIDSSLGEGIKGENIGKELYEKGFRNLVLTTGYPAHKFDNCFWFKEVIGKRFPNDLTF